MKHPRIFLIVAALVLLASGAVAGPSGSMGPGMGPGYGAPPMGAPNLTPEQSQKLQELRQSYFNDIGPLQNQVFSKRAETRMLWSQANPDAGKIAAKQLEIQELETQLREKATQHQLAVRKILTPEQQAQMPGMGLGMGPGKGGRMHGRW
jgi:Spy/CpxP family protein refolding chaperone